MAVLLVIGVWVAVAVLVALVVGRVIARAAADPLLPCGDWEDDDAREGR